MNNCIRALLSNTIILCILLTVRNQEVNDIYEDESGMGVGFEDSEPYDDDSQMSPHYSGHILNQTFSTPMLPYSNNLNNDSENELTVEDVTSRNLDDDNDNELSLSAIRNTRPYVMHQLPTQSIDVGREFRLRLPSDLFHDSVYGSTCDLATVLTTEHNSTIRVANWLQYNSSICEIFALALEKNIGEYVYWIHASNSEGYSASLALHMRVGQFSTWRSINHRFVFDITLHSTIDVRRRLSWQLSILQRLASCFHQTSTGDIVVYGMDVREDSRQVRIIWSNYSLSTQECDFAAIDSIYTVLSTSNNTPSQRLISCYPSTLLHIESVSRLMLHSCVTKPGSRATTPLPHFSPRLVYHITDTSSQRNEGVAGEMELPASTPVLSNTRPVLAKRFDTIILSIGQIYVHKIPLNMFTDLEDGDLMFMSVQLLDMYMEPLDDQSWIYLDVSNLLIVAFTLTTKPDGDTYYLQCTDTGGKTVTNPFVVDVLDQRPPPPQHLLYTARVLTHARALTARSRLSLVWLLLASLHPGYSNATLPHLRVIRLTRVANTTDTAEVSWYISAGAAGCRHVHRVRRALRRLADALAEKLQRNTTVGVYVTAGSGAIPLHSSRLLSAVLNVSVVCSQLGATTLTTPHDNSSVRSGVRKLHVGVWPPQGRFFGWLIPALVLLFMALVCLLLFVCLSFRHRRHKKTNKTLLNNSLEQSSPMIGQNKRIPNQSASSYVSSGVPVIFADELNHFESENRARNKSRSRKTPVIFAHERQSRVEDETLMQPMLNTGKSVVEKHI